MGFLSELKRRKVYNVAAMYAAAAFIVWQAADILVPSLDLPQWTMKAVVVLTALGFPLAVVLAWIYDVTPTQPVSAHGNDGEVAVTAATGAARLQRGLIGVLALAVFAGAGF